MILRRCIFCLAKGAAEIRYDKRSRPFIVCRLCQTRAFVRNLEALRGLAVAPELLEAAIDQCEKDPHYNQWFQGAIARLITDARSAVPTRVEPGLPAVMVEPYEEKKAS